MVFGFSEVADEVGVEEQALVREAVAVAVDLELPLGTGYRRHSYPGLFVGSRGCGRGVGGTSS